MTDPLNHTTTSTYDALNRLTEKRLTNASGNPLSGTYSIMFRLYEVEIGGTAVVVIAGPCAVEEEEQLLSTAREVKAASAGSGMRRGRYSTAWCSWSKDDSTTTVSASARTWPCIAFSRASFSRKATS